MTKKKTETSLFKTSGEENVALSMLKGSNENEEVNEEVTEPAPEEPKEVVKKKTNRGRKRKYQDGEVIKLTVLVDKHLSTTLKTLAKSKGKTVQQVMVPYVEKWLEENQSLDNAYFASTNKKYTGFNVSPELRNSFSESCTEREITQSFVMEALYQQAIEDLK